MAKKTLYFDNNCGYMIAVAVENGKITDFNFEKDDRASVIGNIYKGRVECVLPGMRAAFVNCGLERNCYLSAEGVYPDSSKYDGENGGVPEFPELKEGDEIMVQVTKAPVGKKGARVTLFPSFIGKTLIYMPKTPFVGVSRKISDAELRKNLVYSASRLKDSDEGLVFRTAAPYAKRRQIELELSYLRKLYEGVNTAFAGAQVGQLIYTDVSLPMRVMRDTLIFDIERIIVGSAKLEKLLTELVSLYPNSNRCPVILHDTGRDMLEELGLAEQLYSIASPRAELENGAYLVIERTEALTVIDVNTGKYIGSDSLEQTVYYTNILAAREIARQVHLRNIGGIVVVDFIDMDSPSHRKSLVEELERALKRDSVKCSVAPMSQFGLVEFTRKRSGASPLSLMTRPCRHCRTGFAKAPRMVILGIRAKLLNLYADGNRLLRIDVKDEICNEMAGWEEFTEDMKARLKDARLYCVPHKTYSDEQVHFHCGDTLPLPDKAVKIV